MKLIVLLVLLVSMRSLSGAPAEEEQAAAEAHAKAVTGKLMSGDPQQITEAMIIAR